MVSIKSIKLPLSLPSPRASDPARLEVARANIAFTKDYKSPSESLQKRGAVTPSLPVFLYFLTLAWRFVGLGENDKQFSFFLFPLPASIENCKILANNSSPRTGPR